MSTVYEALEPIVSSIDFNSEIEKDIFQNRTIKFLRNDLNCNNQKELIKIISKINWFNTKQINDFIIRNIKKILNNNIFIFQFKDKVTSSSNTTISFISNEGMCEDNQVLSKEDILNNDLSMFDGLLMLDDYLGSGDTIIDNLIQIVEKVETKKIYIVVYAAQNLAIERLEIFRKENDLDLEIIYKERLDTYIEYLEHKTQDYVNTICSLCSEPDFKIGWKNTGALVAINMCSPNNNISMIWNSHINYNGNRWIPLLSRELNLEAWNKKNKYIIKKNTMLLKECYKKNYKTNFKRYNISYPEFEFLVYSYGCYFPPQELIKNDYFQTIDEFQNFIENLLNNKLIELKNNYIIISNQNLYNLIGKVIKEIYKNNKSFKKEKSLTIDK